MKDEKNQNIKSMPGGKKGWNDSAKGGVLQRLKAALRGKSQGDGFPLWETEQLRSGHDKRVYLIKRDWVR